MHSEHAVRNRFLRHTKVLTIVTLWLFAGTTSADERMSGTYRIRVKQSGKFLHAHAGPAGDQLVSTRFDDNSDYTRFVLKHLGTDFYSISVKATNKQVHVADQPGGDKRASTRLATRDAAKDPLNRYGRFLLKRQTDGSYRIRLLSGSWLRVDGYGDQVLRSEKNDVIEDGYDRFELVKEPVQHAKMLARRVLVNMTNPAPFPAALERLDANGRWVTAATCRPGQTITDSRTVGSRWRCTIGVSRTSFVIGDQAGPSIILGKSKTNVPQSPTTARNVLVHMKNPAPFPAKIERRDTSGQWVLVATCQPRQTITEIRTIGSRWRCTIGLSQTSFTITDVPGQIIQLGKKKAAGD